MKKSLAVVVGSLLLSTFAFAQGCCNCSCQGTSSHMMKQNSCSNHQMMMKHKKMMHKKMMQQKAMMQKNQSENKAEKMMQEGHRLMQEGHKMMQRAQALQKKEKEIPKKVKPQNIDKNNVGITKNEEPDQTDPTLIEGNLENNDFKN